MKSWLAVCTVLFLLSVGLSSVNARCKRNVRRCSVVNFDNEFEFVDYNDCTGICCGAEVVERDVYLQCCGTELRGEVYNSDTQKCCVGADGSVGVYFTANTTGDCCGSELFDREAPEYRTHACCSGNGLVPGQPFNYLTEMCCQGLVQFAGDTAYTSCCFNQSYDRRVASCICEDNIITVGVPENVARCCRSSENRMAYNPAVQGCCNGFSYNLEGQFCCGGAVGDSNTQTCCGGVITDKAPDINSTDVGCCLVPSGRGTAPVAYDTSISVCCGNTIIPRNLDIEEICCGNSLFNVAVFGNRCCGDTAYNPSTNVCCDGVVSEGDICCGTEGFVSGGGQVCCNGQLGDGDRCCNGVPFSTVNDVCCNGVIGTGDRCCNGVHFTYADGNVCCGGVITNGTRCCAGTVGWNPADEELCCGRRVESVAGFEIPACCVNETFDSFVQTCCGVTVYDNPLVPNEQGDLAISHTTRCCGLDDVDKLPYDYNTQACCGGEIVDLVGIPYTSAECCGQNVVNTDIEVCCNGNIVANPFGSRAFCCDDVAIDMSTTLCCNGMARNSSDYVCCGDTSADLNIEICCDGIPTEIDQVPSGAAVCCGDGVVDSTDEICCNGVPQALFDVPPANALCCGSAAIDGRTQVCCAGQPQTLSGAENEVCCGGALMDPTEELCCDNVPRSLNGVDPDKAICCGDGCIDGTTYWCCDGKQYQRGSVTGEDVSGLSCSDLFNP